jgi:hypothetical protein
MVTRNVKNPLSGIAFLQPMRTQPAAGNGTGMMDILRAIDEGNVADVQSLASATTLPEADVATALRRLASLDLVARDPADPNIAKFVLTESGRQIAGLA